ncbi:hypothetical protein Lal_00037623 [Lupinus albus]|nr:hypothetical protein Lal_00037623 [Lupinus albus]
MDDTIIVGDSKEQLNGMLQLWIQALETYEFSISQNNTKFLDQSYKIMGKVITMRTIRFKQVG